VGHGTLRILFGHVLESSSRGTICEGVKQRHAAIEFFLNTGGTGDAKRNRSQLFGRGVIVVCLP
jgi:hypothetical protein